MMRSKRGGILIYMLGMIALLSIVVTQFLMETATEIRYRSQVTHRDDLKILAHSVLDTTIAVLAEINEIDKGLYSPSQDWGTPLQYAKFPIPKNYSVSVTVTDETGKLSIYDEDMKAFGDLMAEMDISYEHITNLKSELKEWLAKTEESSKVPELKPGEKPKNEDKKKTKEQEIKPKPGEPAIPGKDNPDKKPEEEEKKKQRQVYNLLQLQELPSFEKVFFDSKKNPNEKFKVLKDSISILHKGPFNINTAPDVLKETILGDLHRAPTGQEEPYYRSMKELGIEGDAGKDLEKLIDFKTRVLKIDIQVARATVKYYLSAVVEFEDASKDSEDQSQNPGVELKNLPGQSKDAKNKANFKFLALTEDATFDR